MSIEKFRPELDRDGKIKHDAKPYTMVLNKVIQECTDLELIGIWTHFQSLPPDWIINAGYIQNKFKVGRDKAYKLLEKLLTTKLMEKVVTRNADGTFDDVFYVIKNGENFVQPEPLPENPEMDSGQQSSGVNPFPEKPYPEKPYPENQHHTKERVNTNKTLLTKKTKSFCDKRDRLKAENEKRHNFAQSMNQMAREQKIIEEHQEIKRAPMPESLRQLVKGMLKTAHC